MNEERVMTGDLESRVARLEDERGVLDTLYRYAQCLDYRIENEWVDCFTDDAVWGVASLGAPNELTWSLKGHAELATYVARPRLTPDHRLKHMLVEPRLEIEGERCRVVSYFLMVEENPIGPFVRTFGRYRDRLLRCPDGRWRFEERIIEVDGTHPEARPI